jgi:hypothetical protein
MNIGGESAWADAFGNALGNFIVRVMQPRQATPEQNEQALNWKPEQYDDSVRNAIDQRLGAQYEQARANSGLENQVEQDVAMAAAHSEAARMATADRRRMNGFALTPAMLTKETTLVAAMSARTTQREIALSQRVFASAQVSVDIFGFGGDTLSLASASSRLAGTPLHLAGMPESRGQSDALPSVASMGLPPKWLLSGVNAHSAPGVSQATLNEAKAVSPLVIEPERT